MLIQAASCLCSSATCLQVIIFSFSKKECEKLALNMAQLDLNDEDEKKLVDTIYWNAMDCLSEVRTSWGANLWVSV